VGRGIEGWRDEEVLRVGGMSEPLSSLMGGRDS